MIKQFEKQANNFEFDRILALIKNWRSLAVGISMINKRENEVIMESLRKEDQILKFHYGKRTNLLDKTLSKVRLRK